MHDSQKAQESIDRLRSYVNYLEERKQRAQNIYCDRNHTGWYFALCGINDENLSYVFLDSDTYKIELQPVELHPLYTELADTLIDKTLLSRIAGYTTIVTHEIVLGGDSVDWKFASTFAYYLIAALRIKTGVDIIVPMASNSSWSLVPAMASDTLEVKMIEDFPCAREFDPNIKTSIADLEWVENNMLNLLELAIANPQLEIAIESVSTFHQQGSLRMSIVALWAGIEALLNVYSELRFRLSIELAAYLGQNQSEKISIYNQLKKMYDIRSKAVHGAKMDDSILVKHILETRGILRRILIKIAENNSIPTSDELEALLLQ